MIYVKDDDVLSVQDMTLNENWSDKKRNRQHPKAQIVFWIYSSNTSTPSSSSFSFQCMSLEMIKSPALQKPKPKIHIPSIKTINQHRINSLIFNLQKQSNVLKPSCPARKGSTQALTKLTFVNANSLADIWQKAETRRFKKRAEGEHRSSISKPRQRRWDMKMGHWTSAAKIGHRCGAP